MRNLILDCRQLTKKALLTWQYDYFTLPSLRRSRNRRNLHQLGWLIYFLFFHSFYSLVWMNVRSVGNSVPLPYLTQYAVKPIDEIKDIWSSWISLAALLKRTVTSETNGEGLAPTGFKRGNRKNCPSETKDIEAGQQVYGETVNLDGPDLIICRLSCHSSIISKHLTYVTILLLLWPIFLTTVTNGNDRLRVNQPAEQLSTDVSSCTGLPLTFYRYKHSRQDYSLHEF